MSVVDAAAEIAPVVPVVDDLQALREKVALLEQIRVLQGQVGLAPTQPSLQNTAVPKNVKVPEGRYTMSLAEYPYVLT